MFLKTLKGKGVTAAEIAGVMSESYQGGGADFFPKVYAKKLEAWCRKNDVVLIMDEVQAGFGDAAEAALSGFVYGGNIVADQYHHGCAPFYFQINGG